MEANSDLVKIGRDVVDCLLKENAYRTQEIIAGIDGERFHTHDTHQLVLLLTNGKARSALQIAAMGHDVERFAVPNAGKGFPKDRKGTEYEAYKKHHAQKGATIMAGRLQEAYVPSTVINRVIFLISHHDDTPEEIKKLNDSELEVLVGADSLSWLNFSAPNYFNRKETKGITGLNDKMCFMLRKLPIKYWHYIPHIKLEEPKILPYLKRNVVKIAKELGINPPKFS